MIGPALIRLFAPGNNFPYADRLCPAGALLVDDPGGGGGWNRLV